EICSSSRDAGGEDGSPRRLSSCAPRLGPDFEAGPCGSALAPCVGGARSYLVVGPPRLPPRHGDTGGRGDAYVQVATLRGRCVGAVCAAVSSVGGESVCTNLYGPKSGAERRL